jgi:hypothetical protein
MKLPQEGLRRALARPLTIILLSVASALLLAPSAAAAPPEVKKAPPPLTAQWWQSFMSIGDTNALARCDVGTRDIVFLAGTAGGTADRSCTISSTQSILVPLVNVECSTVEGNGRTPAELRSCARHDFVDQATNLFLIIDGNPVSNLDRFRVSSQVFTFTVVANNPFGLPAPSGPQFTLPATTRSVADGYWVLIQPLSPGIHTVSFGGEFPEFEFSTTASYTLTVV